MSGDIAPFGGDFAAFDGDFENLTFCGAAPGNLVGNYIWNWPIIQWMTRLTFNLTGFGYFEFGVFDDNPKYLAVQDELAPVFLPRINWSSNPSGTAMASHIRRRHAARRPEVGVSEVIPRDLFRNSRAGGDA